MTGIHREKNFEQEMLDDMKAGGWEVGKSPMPTGTSSDDLWLYEYHRGLGLYPIDIINWIQQTQNEEYERIKKIHNGGTNQRIITRLAEELDKRGTIDVLRRGFKDIGTRFHIAQFKPANPDLNPSLMALHNRVRCRVMNQVFYSTDNRKSIDVVLFVNGIPVITQELKTEYTQNVNVAMQQYREDRPITRSDGKPEPLLAGKRAIAHMAVSNDEVYMTTRLEGPKTRFLPFNKGNNNGKGNPVNPKGYSTDYLWKEILTPDSLLDLLQNYINYSKVERFEGNRKVTREQLIFPRYHQLEAVRKLLKLASQEGPGHDYLIQHSAGSGKSNSIAWLSHQLATLQAPHSSGQYRRVFDSVIVLTDRTVLDEQLQKTIIRFEQKTGTVTAITQGSVKSAQLLNALMQQSGIIVLTIQTFPSFMTHLAELQQMDQERLQDYAKRHGYSDEESLKRFAQRIKHSTYAIVADEAHSSQSGESAQKLRQALGEHQSNAPLDGDEALEREVNRYKHQVGRANLSYFAMTATPKAKTIERFGRVLRPGQPPEPIHVYSMQQAIEEGYILDVLRNYLTYKTAWKIYRDNQEISSQEVDSKRGYKSLIRWVQLHETNISQKVAIIVEHFRENVSYLLDGEAKAMVVTDSRLAAVKYMQHINQYIRQQGYDLGALVAFSDEVNRDENGLPIGPYTEANMNNIGGQSIPDALNSTEYQVLIVANKYQTGFDQPKLVAMYIDRKLEGVQAVQTLSRLNRIYPGKDKTFVLDFQNEAENILKEFLPFYGTATLTDTTNPNILHDLQHKLDNQHIYTEDEIHALAEANRNAKSKQATLDSRSASIIQRFKERKANTTEGSIEREELDLFVKDLKNFVHLYDFLSQIIDYDDPELEDRQLAFRALIPRLSDDVVKNPIDLKHMILSHHRISKRDAIDGITPSDADTGLNPIHAVGSGKAREVKTTMDVLIEKLNQVFGEGITDNDKTSYVQQLKGHMIQSEDLRQQALANPRDKFIDGDFRNELMNAIMKSRKAHQSMSDQIIRDRNKQESLALILANLVYDALRDTKSGP